MVETDAPLIREAELPTMIAVLGPYRGGTSVVTGILEALGVFIGTRFFEGTSPYSTYEAVGLRNHCLACFDERPGRWCYLGSYAERVSRLRAWGIWASTEANRRGLCAAGGKHPVMCKLVAELADAWEFGRRSSPILIAVSRPERDVVSSWEQAKTSDGEQWWPRRDRVEITRDLIASREVELAGRAHIRLEFDELRCRPRDVIDRLAIQCGLPRDNVQKAVELVRRTAPRAQ